MHPAKKTRTSLASKEPEPVDANGILADIDVQSIDGASSSNAAKLDIDEFFGIPFEHAGKRGYGKNTGSANFARKFNSYLHT